MSGDPLLPAAPSAPVVIQDQRRWARESVIQTSARADRCMSPNLSFSIDASGLQVSASNDKDNHLANACQFSLAQDCGVRVRP